MRGTLKLLSDSSDTGFLGLNKIVDDTSEKTVREVLQDKHPDTNPVHLLSHYVFKTSWHNLYGLVHFILKVLLDC